jgi:hypothetical protein
VKKITIILALFFSTICSINAQELTKARFDKHFFKSVILDTKDVGISPIKWKKPQLITTGIVITTAVLAFTQDYEVQDLFQKNRTKTLDNLSINFLEPWGSGLYSMGSMALLYTEGLIFRNQRSKKTAMLATKAYLISGLYVQIPKYLINRQRPYQGEFSDKYAFTGVCGNSWYKGMPSGHTTSIFSVATVVASEYKKTVWVPILAYSIATLASVSRIYDNKHWASDVVVGAAFGFAIGKLIHKKNNWGLVIN